MEVVEFINARLDEEEADARAAGGPDERWTHDGTVYRGHPTDEVVGPASRPVEAHIARQDPAATLARVAALRAMLQTHRETSGWGPDSSWPQAPYSLWKHLAAIWNWHPDYREDWAL